MGKTASKARSRALNGRLRRKIGPSDPRNPYPLSREPERLNYTSRGRSGAGRDRDLERVNYYGDPPGGATWHR